MKQSLFAAALLAAVGAQSSACASDVAPSANGVKIFSRPPYLFDGMPTIHEGVIQEGDILLEGRLAWAYTGILKTTIDSPKLSAGYTLEAGSKLYGVPLAIGGEEPETLSWCAPRKEMIGWAATCLIAQPDGSISVIPHVQPAFTLSILFDNPRARSLPVAAEVDTGPVSFGEPMTIRYRIRALSKNALDLYEEVMIGSERISLFRPRYTTSYLHHAFLDVSGGLLDVEQKEDGIHVKIVKPVLPGGAAIPGTHIDVPAVAGE